ncbi:MBL fold metallo-hydrolase [Luteolibacter sp. GHJ8]|uniref:MBL fold metallo-hydrolase n=1 Tax=Luteolibacter rhizosphaerae TaxID=2989719 RepID=A0ABT3G909_9BACT|nr:MBL fold metallo-hydrolase [Luteolibacter rhizosphaerae]MCW1916112.1 MBL fold metallo-hydrolase [Luteolibacter rhizosphaerae]
MLYDTTADVIRKALRGLGMAPSEAAAAAGLPEREVLAASRGKVLAQTLRQLAPALCLSPGALAGLPGYTPPACPLAEVQRIELPFDDETVNAWLVADGEGGHLLFDTGDGPNDVRKVLENLGIESVTVLITHEHGDHTGGLRGLGHMALRIQDPQQGDLLHLGTLTIRVIDLPGHCEGAVGYVVEGLGLPLCVTGDALFAGSMGGCAPGTPYREALEALRRNVMTLPPETILLTGHGPASTVASERLSNAFLADLA